MLLELCFVLLLVAVDIIVVKLAFDGVANMVFGRIDRGVVESAVWLVRQRRGRERLWASYGLPAHLHFYLLSILWQIELIAIRQSFWRHNLTNVMQ